MPARRACHRPATGDGPRPIRQMWHSVAERAVQRGMAERQWVAGSVGGAEALWPRGRPAAAERGPDPSLQLSWPEEMTGA